MCVYICIYVYIYYVYIYIQNQKLKKDERKESITFSSIKRTTID